MTLFSEEDIRIINAGEIDSRVKGSAGNPIREHSQYKLERTYCVMCTKAMGWVTQESAKYIAFMKVIAICDDCISTVGEPPLIKADIKEVKV